MNNPNQLNDEKAVIGFINNLKDLQRRAEALPVLPKRGCVLIARSIFVLLSTICKNSNMTFEEMLDAIEKESK